jgi:heme a synthase
MAVGRPPSLRSPRSSGWCRDAFGHYKALRPDAFRQIDTIGDGMIHGGRSVIRQSGFLHGHDPVLVWLLTCCAVIFAMVVLGGITRLTESGLSMVNWHPVMGILPPLGEQAWQAAFSEYQKYPEYQKVNLGMTLEAFKGIYWMEYAHRMLGRAIGVVFFVPYVYFLLTRRLGGTLAARLAIVFLLGALQGLLGWYMVKSGLVSDPEVSPYRLTAHLGLAVAIYAILLWLALGRAARPHAFASGLTPVGLRRLAAIVAGLVFLTVLSGGFVAGNDAGLAYNNFPLMDGRLVPRDYLLIEPAWRNIFENVPAVQFDHRVLAVTTVVLALLLWFRSLRTLLEAGARSALHGLALAALIQFGLGIATLLTSVPVSLGALHQAGALLLLSAALWVNRALRPL